MRILRFIKTQIVYLVLVLVLVACGKKNPTEIDMQSPETFLETAYRQQSEELLHQFFAEWQGTVYAKTDSQLRPEGEIIQEIYAIFQTFYDPFDLSKFSESSWNNNVYTGIRYIIVQPSVSFQMEGDPETDTVEEFRPFLVFPNTQVVYLTDGYRQMLSDFLESAPSIAEKEKRLEFLNTMTRVVPGHWGKWHFCTHPQVYNIRFSSDLSQATVFFRIIYRGGEAFFQKEGDTWEMINLRLTWIE